MPHKTIIRLSGVARNPANGFPARLLAEFERNLIRDRTQAGLSAARARGKTGGRQRKLDEKQRELVVRLYNEGRSVKDICHSLSISKPTFYRYVREELKEGVLTGT